MTERRTKEQIERRVNSLKRELTAAQEEFLNQKQVVAEDLLQMARNEGGWESQARADMEDIGLLPKPRLLEAKVLLRFYSNDAVEDVVEDIAANVSLESDGVKFFVGHRVEDYEVQEVSEV